MVCGLGTVIETIARRFTAYPISLGIYISDLPRRSLKKDFMIMILGKVIPFDTVRISKTSENVLEVDVEKAWKELKLDSGWSNEVAVEIFLS